MHQPYAKRHLCTLCQAPTPRGKLLASKLQPTRWLVSLFISACQTVVQVKKACRGVTCQEIRFIHSTGGLGRLMLLRSYYHRENYTSLDELTSGCDRSYAKGSGTPPVKTSPTESLAQHVLQHVPHCRPTAIFDCILLTGAFMVLMQTVATFTAMNEPAPCLNDTAAVPGMLPPPLRVSGTLCCTLSQNCGWLQGSTADCRLGPCLPSLCYHPRYMRMIVVLINW
jgi:hypothetical protein